MSEELKNAVIELREDDALRITKEALEGGADPLSIVAACREAMEVIGQRFADGQAFIPELIMAGEIMQGVTAELKPYLKAEAAGDKLGTVVMCTVQGDIHDIGKDIVVTMLDIAGFNVVDLGVDVPIAKVVDAVRDNKAQVLGLSGLLTVAFESMKATVAAIDAAGMRGDVKIMLGGAPVTDAIVAFAGADAWGKDAVAAVELAKTWTGGASMTLPDNWSDLTPDERLAVPPGRLAGHPDRVRLSRGGAGLPRPCPALPRRARSQEAGHRADRPVDRPPAVPLLRTHRPAGATTTTRSSRMSGTGSTRRPSPTASA